MKKALLIAITAFVTSLGISQSQFGIQLYSLREQFKKDIPGTLAFIQKTGIRYVEGGDSYGMPGPEFRNLLAKNKISVVSIGADYNELDTSIAAVAEKAKAYGAKFVVCFWIPHKGEQLTKEEADKAILVFNKAGKQLAAKGLKLCYHPHGFEFDKIGEGTVFDYLLKKSNPAYINFEMDVFWIKQPGQDPVTLLKKYPGRFKLMHLKDRAKGTPGSVNGQADVESNCTLGIGDIDIAEIVRVARKQKVAYMFIEDESSRSVEQVPVSWTFLKSIR